MGLGEKLRQARIEAGLSQRQLCGDTITRNMLSLIEHGTAKPSMDTLMVLAARLGKPVSWFLEEAALSSPNQTVMEEARQQFDAGNFAAASAALETYQPGDPVYDREQILLKALTLHALAKDAISQGRIPYALELLEKARVDSAYCHEDLERQRLLLLGRVNGCRVCALLPSLDEELLLRADEAFSSGNIARAQHLLEAMEDHSGSRRHLLLGRIHMTRGHWKEAAECLRKAEEAFPAETIPLLETCFRELKDYKRAYEYACKQK